MSIFEEYGAFKRRFRDSQIVIITNYVVVSSVGIKRVVRILYFVIQLIECSSSVSLAGTLRLLLICCVLWFASVCNSNKTIPILMPLQISNPNRKTIAVLF